VGIGYDVRGIEQVVVWQAADGALVIEGSKPMLRARLHIVRLLPARRWLQMPDQLTHAHHSRDDR
jgi:hypothetical protein